MKRVLLCFFIAAVAQAAALPDLAQLKSAAERGDAAAQFEYASRITFSNSKESFAMALRSAQQGYGPAEDRVGAHYARQAPFDAKNRASLERLAVRYTSRAAFKGIPTSLGRMSQFYELGTAVPKDLGLAYGWCAVAVKLSGGPNPLSAAAYKGMLDSLIAKISSAEIARGREFERTFRVHGDNFVEIDILVRQMKLSAMFEKDGQKGVVVNNARFVEGETKPLNIDGELVSVTCRKISAKTAEFSIQNHEFTLGRP